ncbi:hypothetical protein Tco_1545514 [Tanacetum coccineum]
MPRFSSNDMIHNHYLEEATKKTQESGRNSRPSVMPSAKSQSTANGSKPKPRCNTQTSRNWLASKTSYVTTKTVPIEEHPRNFRNFSDSKYFVCSTCQKCVFNAKKPERQIPEGHRWVPTGKILTSSTTKVNREPQIVQMQISLTNMNANKLLMSVQCSSYREKLSKPFQPLFNEDEEFPPDVHPHLFNVAPPRAPEITPDSPSTTTITEDARAATTITSPLQTSPPDTGVDGPENTITTSGNESFENFVTNEFDSEASSSGTVNVNPTLQNNPL